jgi:hypothetical protein
MPLCPRMFSRSLLRRRRFYGLLAFFGLALYYFRILGASPEPVSGYEPHFKEEMNRALDVAAREGDKTRYIHFRMRSFPRWVGCAGYGIGTETKKQGRMKRLQACK